MKIQQRPLLAIRLCAATLAAAVIGASAAGAQTRPADPTQTTPTAPQATPAEQAKPTAAPPAKPADQAKPPAAATPGTQKPADPKAAQAAPAPAREVTPEAKALKEASSISDPDKQVEALKKVIADFPKTSAANSAENTIINTLTRKASTDIKALQEQAKKFVDGAPTPNEQARRLGSTASGLAGAGVLLDEAEQYAKKSLDMLGNEKVWIEAEKKAAAEAQAEALKRDPKARPRPAQTDADYSSRFVSLRQTGLMTLGQIYDKRGKPADAEKTYREAYTLAPRTGGAAALKLADYAKLANHPFEQLEYLTVATLAGRVTAASRAELEAVYKQTHGGSPADLRQHAGRALPEGSSDSRGHALQGLPESNRPHGCC